MCAKFIWSCLNSVNSIVKTIANSAKCSSISNFGDNYRYLSYKHKIGNHVWDSSYANYINILMHICLIVLQFFQNVLLYVICRLMRDDYTVFNNCAITKEELLFLINHLCTS